MSDVRCDFCDEVATWYVLGNNYCQECGLRS